MSRIKPSRFIPKRWMQMPECVEESSNNLLELPPANNSCSHLIPMSTIATERVLSVHHWNDTLFSFT
ncbi:hypothetical protein, partial [Chitinimonas taiwanensis]|uniref:hypothetical protein n=1 Tax=Chitinimonas taiwanensis TaxID=240412 RepID=UPI0035AE0558